MIPKVIHYCWFGKGPYPELVEKCIKSWKEKLPDYQIKLWNEATFDVNSVQYTKEAYCAKKYAFVADYVRLKVLYEHGGIYLDTDVEVLKSFDDLLSLRAFTGSDGKPSCGIIACEAGNKIIKEFLELYGGKSFYDELGYYDMTPNPVLFTKILKKYGLKNDDTICQKCGDFTIFPCDVFYPKFENDKWLVSSESYTIHHFDGSWTREKDELQLQYEKKVEGYIRLFGEIWGKRIYMNIGRIKKMGLLSWFKFCIAKIRHSG